eukprot:Em0014g729a
MHRVSSPGATVQSGQSLSSKPFVWPGASDPPAAAKKLDAKEDLKQLSDQLREMKEDAFSNTMLFTIQNALMGKIEVEVYCDEWPQFKAVAARITSPTVADVVLYTKSEESALGLLYDERILRRLKSQISRGVIFAEMKDSLAQYLTDKMKCGGISLLRFDVKTQSTMMQYQRGMQDQQKPPNDIHESPPCPPGYVLGSLSSEHAQYISGLWRFKDDTNDISQTFESIIKDFPSSAVFEESKGEMPVGWILSFPHGYIGHAMILEDHRNKHLFKPLAWNLCTKLLKEFEGCKPEFASDNTIVINNAKENGFVEISKGHRVIYNPPNGESDTKKV